MRKRATVRAVWDSDLQELLKSLGLFESLSARQLQCARCQREIDLANLGALFSDGHDLRVTCDDATCVRAATAQEVTSAGG